MEGPAILNQLYASLQDISTNVYNSKESDLFILLERAKPTLLQLLDVGGQPSETERKALRDGMPYKMIPKRFC